jgi:hypothetical protein
MIVEGSTVQEGVSTLLTLRRYAPYRFGGKWFVAIVKGECVALRSVAQLRKKAVKAGEETLSYATVA